MDSSMPGVASLDFSYRVLSEMGELLEKIRQLTMIVVEHPQDHTAFDQLVEVVGQAHYSVRLIGCFGAELLSDEYLNLLEAIQNGTADEKADTSSVMVLASEKLIEYVEYLKAGEQDLPLALLSIVNNMRACRGVGLLSEALIVSPQFQIPQTLAGDSIEDEAEVEFFDVLKRTRLPFMRDLLAWFNNPSRNTMQPLVTAFANLQISSPSANLRNLWAAARALAASLADDGLEASAAVKMLLGQLERYMDRLDRQTRLSADPEFPANLFKNLLYYVALSESTDTTVKELKQQYRLSELLPPRKSLEMARGALGGPGARLAEAICGSLGNELGEVKAVLDSIDVLSEVDASTLDDASHRLRQVSYTLLLLGLSQARNLNERAVAQLNDCRERTDYANLQDVAADILRVDAALEEYLHGGGRPSVFADELPDQDEQSERLSEYQYGLIVEQCLAEAARCIQSVQHQYLSVLADDSRRSLFEESAQKLESVGKALQILPLPELQPLMQGAAHYLRQVAGGYATLSNIEQSRFAELMVCSELYLDSALQKQPAAADLLMYADHALSDLMSGEVDDYDATSSVEPLAEIPKEQPDTDMMSVFIDEALGSLSIVNREFTKLKDNADSASLERMRRQYHILKGSGMMSGAVSVAQLSSSVEGLLDGLITESQLPDLSTIELLDECSGVLPQLINQLSNPAQDGLQKIDGLDNLIARIDLTSQRLSDNSMRNPVKDTQDGSVADAIEIFEKTITTQTETDEFGETMSLQFDANTAAPGDQADLSGAHSDSIAARAAALDDDFARTISLDVLDADVRTTPSFQIGPNNRHNDSHNDGEYTRTIALDDNAELIAGAAHESEFTRTISLDEQGVSDNPAAENGHRPHEARAQSATGQQSVRGSHHEDGLERTEVVDRPEFSKGEMHAVDLDETAGADVDGTQMLTLTDIDNLASHSLDNTLLRVFFTECLAHITMLKELLSPSISGKVQLPTAEMQRSLHTMRGSAHTADVPSVAKLIGPLEDVVNSKLSAARVFDEEETSTVKDVVYALELLVDALSEGRPVPAVVEAATVKLATLVRRNNRAGQQASERGGAATALQDLYIDEATELLSNIHEAIGGLRDSDDHLEHVNQLRADLHTLKGGARVAQFNAIADITHALEGALSRWVTNLPVGGKQIAKLQEVADAVTVNLDQARTGGSLGQFDWLIHELNSPAIVETNSAEEYAEKTSGDDSFELTHFVDSPFAESAATADHQESDWGSDTSELAMMDTGQLGAGISNAADLVRLDAAAVARLSELSTEVSIHQARVGDYFGELRDSLIDLDKTTDRLRYKLRDLQKETDSTLAFLESTLSFDTGSETSSDATARLEPADLERFTQRREDARQLSEILADFDAIRARLHDRMRGSEESLSLTSRLGSEIQQSLMRSQLIRFGQHSQRLSSTVRQTAAALDRRVRLELSGSECSIDRGLHKQLLVPLEHLIRNAIAHGIESVEQRVAAGKAEEGVLTIDVRFDGNDLVLCVSDDGAGVDYDSVRQRLRKNLSDQQVLDALFETGMTTVDKANQYAGRGVGLDVVARTLADNNGAVSIISKLGEGTSVTMRIPQRVVIHQVVLVELEDSVFGIPVNNVHTVVACENEETIEFNGGDYESFRLSELLGLTSSRLAGDKTTSQAILIEAGERKVALQVNQVPGYRELVARPLGKQVSSLHVYTGGSVLANGRSVLILDLNRLLQDAEQRQATTLSDTAQNTMGADILVIDDSVTMRTYADRILTKHGYSTVFARDGIEALERLKDFTPHLVLLDIEMPRMNGFELLEKMRAHPRLKELPVVIVSSRSSMKHRRRASELGVQSYIVKPYREEELTRLLTRMSLTADTEPSLAQG